MSPQRSTQNPDAAGTSLYRRHMAGGFFATHWPYGTQSEVHGLTDKAMHIYVATKVDPLRVWPPIAITCDL